LIFESLEPVVVSLGRMNRHSRDGPSAQSKDHDDESEEHEGRKQTERRDDVCVSIGKAPSDIPTLKPYRVNPPYGMIGGTVETAASFEARFAPRSYPTIIRSPLRAIALPDRRP